MALLLHRAAIRSNHRTKI